MPAEALVKLTVAGLKVSDVQFPTPELTNCGTNPKEYGEVLPSPVVTVAVRKRTGV